MSENDILNGDDEYSQGNEGEDRVCRDFMRNVCNRGNNCKFIHPHDIKIRNDPIFCHDYQQTKCFRSTCKFIHCSREEEEHYKSTGELPETFTGGDGYTTSRGGGKGMRGGKAAKQNGANGRGGGGRGGRGGGGRASTLWDNDDASDIPLCKDYLKGVCDRPPGGCKFRHSDQDGGSFRGGGRGGAGNRRRPGAASYYDGGPSDTKRSNSFGGTGRSAATRLTEFEQYEDYYNPEYSNPPAPVGNQPVYAGNRAAYGTTSLASHHSATSPSYLSGRNGYGNFANAEVATGTTATPYTTTVFAATSVKAVEDENFMLKRRIEELKKQVSDLVATNEYLLSQNAHLRLNNMNVNAIMAKEVQNVTGAGEGVTGTSVVHTLVSMAQPMGITPSLSTATPISLSSISTGPTVVSMPAASISQPLPAVVNVSMAHQPQSVYPMVTSQGVLPPPN